MDEGSDVKGEATNVWKWWSCSDGSGSVVVHLLQINILPIYKLHTYRYYLFRVFSLKFILFKIDNIGAHDPTMPD